MDIRGVGEGASQKKSSSGHSDPKRAPPPKKVEQDIYEYVDSKNKDTFFTTNLL